MSRQAISTGGAPAAIGPYSQGIRSGDMLFCSGQLGLDPVSGELADGVEAQAERALRNLASVLDAAGLGFDDVVKTTIFLADIGDFAAVNARLRPVHAGSATGPLDRPGGCAAEGRTGRNRGDRPASPGGRRVASGALMDATDAGCPPRRLRRRSSDIRASLDGLTDAQLDARPSDGGWTPREVVHHTADSEMTSAIRLRRLIAEDDPLIVGYDGDEFARRLHYATGRSSRRSTAIDGARATTAQILAGLTEAEWGRTGTHSESGPVRRRALARDLRRRTATNTPTRSAAPLPRPSDCRAWTPRFVASGSLCLRPARPRSKAEHRDAIGPV